MFLGLSSVANVCPYPWPLKINTGGWSCHADSVYCYLWTHCHESRRLSGSCSYLRSCCDIADCFQPDNLLLYNNYCISDSLDCFTFCIPKRSKIPRQFFTACSIAEVTLTFFSYISLWFMDGINPSLDPSVSVLFHLPSQHPPKSKLQNTLKELFEKFKFRTYSRHLDDIICSLPLLPLWPLSPRLREFLMHDSVL